MARHFILDGYNILHQMTFDPALGFEEQRLRLIDQVEARRPQGSKNNDLTVIFDGRPGAAFVHRALSLKIIFSQDRSADDVIRRLTASSGNPKIVTVVTDDRELRSAVRANGAAVMSVGEFLNLLSSPPAQKKRPAAMGAGSGTGKYISKSAEFAINKEMAEVWLNKKRSQ